MANDARLLTNLRKGLAEVCVLALLQAEPTYGLDLARRLQRDGLVAGESTLYPLLARLSSSGLVESEWRTSPAGRPRKYYSITADGREAMAAFETSWISMRNAVDQTLRR
jgi:PadR family transcriptional regulator, regulatory protein PadR